MEFEHVGKHCSHPLCRQKDFLPFTCAACHQSYCLEHRSFVAHDCSAGKNKDFTSLDCPICNKSVRFTLAEDANAVWENHHLNDCIHHPSAKLPPTPSSSLKCCRPGCRAVLGPSNAIQCSKCHKKTCISHRMAEDHQCSGLPGNRDSFLQKFDGQAASGSSKAKQQLNIKSSASSNKSTKPTSELSSISKSSKAVDPVNTLRGSVARRMKNGDGVASASVSEKTTQSSLQNFVCPFCSTSYSSLDELQQHIGKQHEESTTPERSTISSTPVTQEICPICEARFPNVGDLVTHVERSHQQYSSQSEPVPSQNDGDGLCLLS